MTCIQASIVKTLTHKFGDLCLFFWNPSKGDYLGLVWKPKALLTNSFSILDSRHALPLAHVSSGAASGAGPSESEKDSGVVVVNVAKIISEMIETAQGAIGDVIIR